MIKTNLKSVRLSKGFTQEETATKSKISLSAYQQYEYGHREPQIRTAYSISNALGVKDLRELWSVETTD